MVKKQSTKKKFTNSDFVEMGFDMGSDLVEQAMVTARTPEQAENQMLILRGAAIYMISTIVFNESAFINEETNKPDYNPSLIQSKINDMNDEVRLVVDQFIKDLKTNKLKIVGPNA